MKSAIEHTALSRKIGKLSLMIYGLEVNRLPPKLRLPTYDIPKQQHLKKVKCGSSSSMRTNTYNQNPVTALREKSQN